MASRFGYASASGHGCSGPGTNIAGGTINGGSSKEAAPLMPALQNKFWLHFHVSVAIFAYGALALSCATGIMYFVKRKWAGPCTQVAEETQ